MTKKKTLYSLIVIGFLMLSVIPVVMAISNSSSVTPGITVEPFTPRVWMCNHRIVLDDFTEPGRISNGSEELVERINNYAFEGEQINWIVLVMDKNKIDQNIDVFTTIGIVQGSGNSIQANCNRIVGDPFGNSTANVTVITDVTCSSNETAPTNVTNLLAAISCTVNEPLAGNNITCSINNLSNATTFAGSGSLIVNGTNISFSANATSFIFDAIAGGVSGNCSVDDLPFANSSGSCSFNITNTITVGTTGVNNTCIVNGVSNSVFATSSGILNLAVNGVNISVFVSAGTTVDFSAIIGGVSGNCSVTGLLNSTSSGLCSFSILNTETITSGNPFVQCGARIDEEKLTEFDPATMSYFDCLFTVETPESMYGEYWVTVEAQDGDSNNRTMAENEYWFFNPVVALSIDGDMTFNNVRPGTDAYSSTMLVGNDANDFSGVMMDMFISGTDFYDISSSGARCPTTNQLSLSAFRYFATNGAYSTNSPYGISYTGPTADAEGYKGIIYGIGFNNPTPFYNKAEIIPAQEITPYYAANLLAPGAEMAITFKLSLPEPCNGDFDSGSIYFWGEAI